MAWVPKSIITVETIIYVTLSIISGHSNGGADCGGPLLFPSYPQQSHMAHASVWHVQHYFFDMSPLTFSLLSIQLFFSLSSLDENKEKIMFWNNLWILLEFHVGEFVVDISTIISICPYLF